mmetsp:Transcript_12027/g.26256  ORF Transcript_12027/g.26256 Transcript_12027/m.26256 type:complete len:203 (-) Transcript_12027:287-895(-)
MKTRRLHSWNHRVLNCMPRTWISHGNHIHRMCCGLNTSRRFAKRAPCGTTRATFNCCIRRESMGSAFKRSTIGASATPQQSSQSGTTAALCLGALRVLSGEVVQSTTALANRSCLPLFLMRVRGAATAVAGKRSNRAHRICFVSSGGRDRTPTSNTAAWIILRWEAGATMRYTSQVNSTPACREHVTPMGVHAWRPVRSSSA